MKRILITLLAAATFLSVPALAQDDPRIATGEAAAEAWLALSDAGSYDASWEQSAATFQATVPRADWLSGISRLRKPLGKMISRTPSSARFAESIAGAPNGEYVSIIFETEFENKKQALETVSTTHEKDGSWKVMGYQLR